MRRKKRPIWHRIIPFSLLVISVLWLAVAAIVHEATADDATDAADAPVAASSSVSASSTSASKVSSTAKAATLSKTQVAAKQQSIKQALNTYLAQITKSGHVAVSFYNLAPVAGSSAAKAKDAAVYAEGALATSANAKTQMVAASTYKLYITAWLFHEVATGAKTWTSSDESGFQAMIVNSQNDYAESVLKSSGGTPINTYLSQFGITSPFHYSGAATTSSDNLLTMLKLLVKGQDPFANATYRNKLLTAMGKQVYRDGIPAAATAADPGSTVQDKVGWLGTTDNDAAIVTTAAGQRYLLVIMTDNGSYQNFSAIKTYAEKIQTIVYGG